jgi:hypothetical protein
MMLPCSGALMDDGRPGHRRWVHGPAAARRYPSTAGTSIPG